VNIPWWGWAAGVVVALFALVRRSAVRHHARVEQELVYYLQECFPSLSFVRQEGRTMVIKHEGGRELHLYMRPLYLGISRTRDRSQRRALYDQTARALVEQAAPSPPDPAKLRPRLVPESKLPELPSRRLEGLGLRIAYVLDAPVSVRYVTAEVASQLGLDEPALYARALANLAIPGELVRGPLEKRAMTVVKTRDGHDAARLLGVPAHLRDDESLLALIPDVNTLVLVAGAEPASLSKLARNAEGEPLFDGVVRVTRDGFTRAS
jgi:hypothetical protein